MTVSETIEEAKKVGVKDMSWKAWFMIITIISAATVASFYGVNVTMNIDLANRVGSLEGMLSHTINSTFYALQKPVSYIISTVTSGATTYYCMQNGTTGKLDFWSTTYATVFNAAVDALPTSADAGGIFVRAGAYTVTAALGVGQKTRVKGEGAGSVVFTVAANVDCFAIDSCLGQTQADWEISGVTIDMADYNGNGVYGVNVHSTNGTTRLSNVLVDNVDTGYAGFNLTDPMNLYADSLSVYGIGAATGLYLYCNQPSGTDYGNSRFSNIICRGVGAGGYGIKIVGTSNSGPASNFYDFNLIQLIGNDATTAYGVYMTNTSWCNFENTDIERMGIGVYLDFAAHDNTFTGGTIRACTVYGIYTATSVSGNLFMGVDLGSGSIPGYYCGSTIRWLPNQLIGCVFDTVAAGDKIVCGNNTNIFNCAFVSPMGLETSPWSTYQVSTYYTCRPDGGDVAAASLVSARRYKVIGADMQIFLQGGNVTDILIEDFSNADVYTLSGIDLVDNGLYLSVPVDYRITVTYATVPSTVLVSFN